MVTSILPEYYCIANNPLRINSQVGGEWKRGVPSRVVNSRRTDKIRREYGYDTNEGWARERAHWFRQESAEKLSAVLSPVSVPWSPRPKCELNSGTKAQSTVRLARWSDKQCHVEGGGAEGLPVEGLPFQESLRHAWPLSTAGARFPALGSTILLGMAGNATRLLKLPRARIASAWYFPR